MTAGRPGGWVVWVVGALAALAAIGCGGVNRRFVIESNVPNAQVFIDDKPVGAAPAHAPFEYYGFYNIKLVHPDHRTEVRRIHVVAPWYAYPPIDFLAEVVWPFRVEDVRRYYIELTPGRQTDTGELISNADALRARGWSLPQPEHPAVPKAVELPAPAELPPPAPVIPLPGPTSPFVPSVTPAGLRN